jgi:hypothetical protein
MEVSASRPSRFTPEERAPVAINPRTGLEALSFDLLNQKIKFEISLLKNRLVSLPHSVIRLSGLVTVALIMVFNLMENSF